MKTVNMNPRERWGLLLIDEQPDRLIAYPLVTACAASVVGATVGDYCRDGEIMARAQLKALETFGHEGVSLFADVGILAEAMGSKFIHGDCDVPVLDEPLLSVGDDPARLAPPPPTAGRLGQIVTAADICHGVVGDRVPVFAFVPGPFTTSAMLAGLDDFLMDLVMAPDRAKTLLDIASRAAVPFCDALMCAGALPVIVEPLASGSVISPAMFEEFAAPAISGLVTYLHRFDLDVMLHVCGHTDGMFREVAQTGADLLSLDTVDLAETSKAVGASCRLVGNVSTTVMREGTPGEVRADVAQAIEKARDNPAGYVVSSGCEVPIGTPAENIAAFVAEVRERGGRAKGEGSRGKG